MHLHDRLIVAADFKPAELGGIQGVRSEVLKLANDLKGSGVIIKVNSVLRAAGYSLLRELRDFGLQIFADLKLIDIPATMAIDGEFLAETPPDLLTVMCCAGVDGMHSVAKVLPSTRVLGVTVLTSLNEEECQAIFTCSTKAGVLRFARMAQLAGLDGLILSPAENEVLRKRFEIVLSLNNPAIRPSWSLVEGDDQDKSRIMTPKRAILNGADRIVVGRPILQAPDRRDAVRRTLYEIQEALAEKTEGEK